MLKTNTITSSQAQHNLSAILDQEQNQIIPITNKSGAVSLLMSPQVLEDYVKDCIDAGLHNAKQSQAILDKYR